MSGLRQARGQPALILAAARLAGCAAVFSEALHAGQDYGGVRVENPLPA